MLNKFAFVLILNWVGFFSLASAQTPDYKVKAVWLEHFSKFIEWPDLKPEEPFIVKVIGSDIFDSYLSEVYKSRKIKDRTVIIEYIQKPEDIGHCHILFISKNFAAFLPKILDKTEGKSILTIGDTSGFCEDGVIINFFTEKNKIKFEFNITSAKQTKLDVSFRLLESARIVKK